MPYVRILWKPDLLAEDRLLRLRDALPTIVAEALSRFDPQNIVTGEMVDLRIEQIGPLDLVHPDMLITIFARREPARHQSRDLITELITNGIVSVGCPANTMVELVLTDRTSTYRYPGDA